MQFLFIGSRLCSTLLSDLPSRFGPCASLSLHLHLVVKRTCTSQLSNMLGTQKEKGSSKEPPFSFCVPSMFDSWEVQVLFTTRWRCSESEAQGPNREGGTERSVEQGREPMNQNWRWGRP